MSLSLHYPDFSTTLAIHKLRGMAKENCACFKELAKQAERILGGVCECIEPYLFLAGTLRLGDLLI
jgi:hypothetical protein